MARYEFTGPAPWSFRIVFALAFVNFSATWIVGAFRQFWARESSSGEFTYPILFKGGHIWYFTPIVGRYFDWSFAGNVLFLALLGLICYRHRDGLVRRGSPKS